MSIYSVFIGVELLIVTLGSLFRQRKATALIATVLAILFCGLRFETGYDYNAYRSFFENIDFYKLFLEPGFFRIVKLGDFLNMTSFQMFFAFSVMTHGMAYVFFTKTTDRPNLALLLYLLIPGLYLNSFSIVRQALAVVLFAYSAYRLINYGNKKEYFLWNLLAVSIHFPAIVAFLFGLLIYTIPIRFRNMGLMLFLFFAAHALGQARIDQMVLGLLSNTKYGYYLFADDGQDRQGLLKVIAASIIGLTIIAHHRVFEKNKMYAFFFSLYFVGLLFYNMFVYVTPMTRLSYYFSILSIPLLLVICENYRSYWKFIAFTLILLFYALAFSRALHNDSFVTNELNVSNYKTIWHKTNQ